ncbi:helix-turn-helix domain-containing protein [Nocardia ninae]|uniref:AraC family transcriptional regulator n=1 Tax=Nocardia ninae NBRC 108245 TaxID=1210091 RepID=A0A511MLG9_9NOCA|nr:helix-turn-helix domain-containing protein [Nocardia ninae]GEM40988.1 AraC family transcriptional regulator [Nocardia ninae NBRC 108245]
MRHEFAMTDGGHSIGLAVVPETPIFEAALVCEVFGIHRRDLVDPWYRFSVHPTEPSTPLTVGFMAAHASALEDLADLDTIIVTGRANPLDGIGAPSALLAVLREADRRGVRIASICSGAFVLAEAGLLDGRTATTHWMHATALAQRYPDVSVAADVLYHQEGNIWTSAGTAAGIDLCLELIRRDHGGGVAAEVARRMVVPPHRSGGQAQFVPASARQGDHGPSEPELLRWARERLAEDLTVADLARRAGLSHRTLIRRFKATTSMTPQQWLSRERITHAQRLLETTDLPVDRIAHHCGLGTAANLRAKFRQHLGVTPTSYRRTFATGSDTPEHYI